MLPTCLFGVTTWDPATHAAAAMTPLACSIAACWLPARRALRVDPVVAFRAQQALQRAGTFGRGTRVFKFEQTDRRC
jgi:hypothetical protein